MKTTNAQQNNDVKKIEQTIIDFTRAADSKDKKTLDHLMHPEFRSVLNRLMGNDTLSVMDKSTYLSLVEQGRIGGDKRDITIVSLGTIGNNASAHVILKGTRLTFQSYFHLVKNREGVWLIINDLPSVEKNN